jgi:hypothetical protein
VCVCVCVCVWLQWTDAIKENGSESEMVDSSNDPAYHRISATPAHTNIETYKHANIQT